MEKIDNILIKMSNDLTNEQLLKLKIVLSNELIEINSDCTILSTNIDDNNDVINKYLFDLRISQHSQQTIRMYKFQLNKFFDTINKNFRDVCADDLQLYIAEKIMNNISVTSINNCRKIIIVFYKWLLDNEYINKTDIFKIKNIKDITKEKIVLNNNEIEIIRDNCETKAEIALVDFLLSTGVRVGELVNIKCSDINFIKNEVKIYANKTRNYRTVFLDAKSVKHLIEYIDAKKYPSQWLFSNNRNDTKLNEYTVERWLHKIEERCNIGKKLTVHVFRKTLASRLHYKGMPAENISLILGHSNIHTTMKYYITVNGDNLHNEFSKCIY